jgi:hypothetical protein
MGIQINGNTDTITAVDGSLTVTGAELSAVTNLNATGVTTVATLNVGAGGTIISTTGIGSVGIGTTNPRARLHLCAQPGYDGDLILDDVNRNAIIYAPSVSSTVGGEFYFRKGLPGSYTDRLIIDNQGNIKIGAGATFLNSSGNPILRQTGSILQVSHTDFTTSGSMTASSDTNISGFSASITPTSTSNKILAIVHFTGCLDCDGRLKLKRNGTVVRDFLLGTDRSGGSTAAWNYYDSYTVCASYLDSPSSTSSVTYQISAHVTGCSSAVYYNRDPSGSDNNGRSGITLMEVVG